MTVAEQSNTMRECAAPCRFPARVVPKRVFGMTALLRLPLVLSFEKADCLLLMNFIKPAHGKES